MSNEDKDCKEHSWTKGRCNDCGRRAKLIAPDGQRFESQAKAKQAGFHRDDLISEENEDLIHLLENDSAGG